MKPCPNCKSEKIVVREFDAFEQEPARAWAQCHDCKMTGPTVYASEENFADLSAHAEAVWDNLPRLGEADTRDLTEVVKLLFAGSSELLRDMEWIASQADIIKGVESGKVSRETLEIILREIGNRARAAIVHAMGESTGTE
jgi:hypothetical protein